MALKKNNSAVSFNQFQLIDSLFGENKKVKVPSIATYTEVELKGYLSEVLSNNDRLPVGRVTKPIGAGATTFVLSNNFDTIVCVPSINLVLDKVKEFKGSVYGCSSESPNWDINITEYIKSNKIRKFIVVYDSLKTLIDLIGDYSNYQLIIDEYHCYLTDFGYRSKALRSLNELSTQFKYVSLLSATPLKECELPAIWKNLSVTNYISKSPKSICYKKKTRTPISDFVKLGKLLLRDKGIMTPGIIRDEKYLADYNAKVSAIKEFELTEDELWNKQDLNKEVNYIATELVVFVNSVKTIIAIIKKLELKPSQVAILCSKGNNNQAIINGELGGVYTIGKGINEERMFTFVTSTGFAGLSLHSVSACNFALCSVNKVFTLLSQRQLTQLAGRIRTKGNPFQGDLRLLYSEGRTKLSNKEIEAGKSFLYSPVKLEFEKFNKDLQRNITMTEEFTTYSTTIKDQIFENIDENLNFNYLIRDGIGGVELDEDKIRSKKENLLNCNSFINNNEKDFKGVERLIDQANFEVGTFSVTQYQTEEEELIEKAEAFAEKEISKITTASPIEQVQLKSKFKKEFIKNNTVKNELEKSLNKKTNSKYFKTRIETFINYLKEIEKTPSLINTKYEIENKELKTIIKYTSIEKMTKLRFDENKIKKHTEIERLIEIGKVNVEDYLKTIDLNIRRSGEEMRELANHIYKNILFISENLISKVKISDLGRLIKVKQTKTVYSIISNK